MLFSNVRLHLLLTSLRARIFPHHGIDGYPQIDYNMHKRKHLKTEVYAMDIKQVLSHLDTLLEQQQMSAAADYLDKMAAEAELEGDTTARLTLYNEIIGFHRVSGNREKSYAAAEKALALLRENGMDNTIHYATTLLNYATARVIFRELPEALKLYREVETLYARLLDPVDYRIASLYNNISQALLKSGDAKQGGEYLEKSLAILEQLDEDGVDAAIATCLTNIGYNRMSQGDLKGAEEYLTRAEARFKSFNYYDPHYDSVLAGFGQLNYRKGDYPAAADYFDRAAHHVESLFGRNQNYALCCRNAAAAWRAAGNAEKAAEYEALAASAK